MWTTKDGYVLRLPQNRLRAIAAARHGHSPGEAVCSECSEQEIERELRTLVQRSHRAGSAWHRATGRSFPLFVARHGHRRRYIVTRPLSGMQHAIVAMDPPSRQAEPIDEPIEIVRDAPEQAQAPGDLPIVENGAPELELSFDAQGAELELELELQQPPALFAGFTPSEQKAIAFTSTQETGIPFGLGGVSGNFDGQGISFGTMQWNIGAGSLQPHLLSFIGSHPDRFQQIFGDGAAPFEQVLRRWDSRKKAEAEEQLRYVIDTMNTKVWSARKKKDVWVLKPAWKARWDALARDPGFQRIAVEHIRKMVVRAASFCRLFELVSERALVLSFDGIAWPGPNWATNTEIRAKITQGFQAKQTALGRPLTEMEKLRVIADVFGDLAKGEWRERARARKWAIVNGGTYREVDVAKLGVTDAPFTSSGGAAVSAPSAPAAVSPTSASASPPNPTLPLEDLTSKLAETWSKRRNGSPPFEEMKKWLLQDQRDTLEGAKSRYKKRFTDEAINRAWLTSREEQMKFQTSSSKSLKSVRGLAPPRGAVALVTTKLVSGSDEDPVAPVVVRFVSELRRIHPAHFDVSTYARHGLGAFAAKGHSIDLYLGQRDERGFFKPDEAVKFLRAVGEAAKAVGVEWRILYNDFSVANVINRESGVERVVFVGNVPAGKNNILWHGPHPLILHFHLDLGTL